MFSKNVESVGLRGGAMFNKEIYKKHNKIKIAWYPNERVCLVIQNKSQKLYNRIPKKYLELFSDKNKYRRRLKK